jgi:hypothetical protein
MNYQEFINELLARWSAEKPAFFKKLQNIALAILVLSGIPTLLIQYGIEFPLPQWLTASLALLGAAAATISQFTVTSVEKVRLKLMD